MSPVPPITHLLAAAIGIFGAISLVNWVKPDVPGEDAVVAAEAGVVTAPGDDESFFRGGALSSGLVQAAEDLQVGQEIVSIRVAPDRLDIDSEPDGGVELSEVNSSAIEFMIFAIGQARSEAGGGAVTLDVDAVSSAEFLADGGPGTWTVRLVPSLPGPHVYRARVPVGKVAFQIRVTPVPGS